MRGSLARSNVASFWNPNDWAHWGFACKKQVSRLWN